MAFLKVVVVRREDSRVPVIYTVLKRCSPMTGNKMLRDFPCLHNHHACERESCERDKLQCL